MLDPTASYNVKEGDNVSLLFSFLFSAFFKPQKKGRSFYTAFKLLPLSQVDMKGIPKAAVKCSMTAMKVLKKIYGVFEQHLRNGMFSFFFFLSLNMNLRMIIIMC